MAVNDTQSDFDVVIVGAGISGINFAYRLKEKHPNLSYCILDGRGEIGGTWSLFKYPGIRSDSDLYTFGFAWRPWNEDSTIAEGSLIVNYVKESAAQEGIDKKIKFNHKVDSMNWSSAEKKWTMNVTANEKTQKTIRGRFLLLGTGYYDYDNAMDARIPGLENFKGTTIHPQFWPEDLDYKDKNMVIVGSGATAITLLPNLVKGGASHVTMLQRSPSYVMTVPQQDNLEKLIRATCPTVLARKLIRWKWMFLPFMLVSFCRSFPNAARNMLSKATRAQLPDDISMDPHFSPSYSPFEQRMCMCPDGDFYECLRKGKGSVATGHIEQVTEKAIKLKSGEELHPDIIVTATGLKMRILGGIKATVDGQAFNVAEKFCWKGCMLEDLPNAVFSFGYVDASWTLGADATAHMANRLISTMEKEDTTEIVPRRSDDDKQNMKETPFVYLTSTYVERGKGQMPKTGDRAAWAPRSYYWKDLAMAKFGDIRTGLEWVRGV